MRFVIVARGCCLYITTFFSARTCSVAFLLLPLATRGWLTYFALFGLRLLFLSLWQTSTCAHLSSLLVLLALCISFFLGGEAEPFVFFAFSSAMHIVVSRETFGCAPFPRLDAEFGTFCCGGGFALGLVLFAFYTSLFCLPA